MPSDHGRLRACPICHSTDIRATTPLAPESDAYECDRCEHRWTE